MTTKHIRKIVGENIAHYRQAQLRGASQADLSRRIREVLEIADDADQTWSRSAVWAAENGDRAFTVDDIVALALALKVQPGAMLTARGSSADVEGGYDRIAFGGKSPRTSVAVDEYHPIGDLGDPDSHTNRMREVTTAMQHAVEQAEVTAQRMEDAWDAVIGARAAADKLAGDVSTAHSLAFVMNRDQRSTTQGPNTTVFGDINPLEG